MDTNKRSDDKPIDNPANYSYNSEANSAQRDALQRVCAAIRDMNTHLVTLNSETAALNDIASKIEGLNQTMSKNSSSRLLEFFRPDAAKNITHGLQPYSPVGGTHSPLMPELNYRVEEDTVLATTTFGVLHEGPPKSVHGGVISAVFDQIMAIAGVVNERAGPTAWITIKYRQPTPLYKPLDFAARIDRIDGKKTFVVAECRCEGEIVCEAEGLFIFYVPEGAS